MKAAVVTEQGVQYKDAPKPSPKAHELSETQLDLRDIKGQESAKRALELAAAGGHHLLMIGSPGAGKSMLAARLPSILPPLSPEEMLDVSMVHSLAGELMGASSPPSGRSARRIIRPAWRRSSAAAPSRGRAR